MAEENKVTNTEEINYTTNTLSSEGVSQDEPIPIKQEEIVIGIDNEFVKPKKKILFKVLIGIISLLIMVIIIGAIFYFTGFFEHKEEQIKEETTHIEQPVQEVAQSIEKSQTKEDSYKFNIKDINSKKLNDQLTALTNKNIEKKEDLNKQIADPKKEVTIPKNNEDELAKEKAEFEKQKAEQEKIKTESLTTKSEDVNIKIEEPKKENIENKNLIKEEKDNKTEFLLFINVVKIKDVLYKKYLDKITIINPNVKLCRNEKNKIEIYYGPFKSNEERAILLDKLIKNKFMEAYELEFTQEEFDKRCNY